MRKIEDCGAGKGREKVSESKNRGKQHREDREGDHRDGEDVEINGSCSRDDDTESLDGDQDGLIRAETRGEIWLRME